MKREALTTRARMNRQIREFFFARDVMEVETSLLCSHTITNPYIDSISAGPRYLQTSPEYCMKRLLCAGSGPIYQLGKAFRHEESGRHHNPEFTLLEWYRPDYNHHDLMQELEELLTLLLHTPPADKKSYRDCFLTFTQIDPLTCDIQTLYDFITEKNLLHDLTDIDHDTALQLILSEYIEPKINPDIPFFLYDFHASKASLAKIRQDDCPVGERFELYYQGLELANGFHELADADEQQKRFEHEQEKRKRLNRHVPRIDHYLIEALKKGMPNTAGVAVGLDRIVMIAMKAHRINEVLAFPWEQS